MKAIVKPLLVVIGVSGSGKTTVGKQLASELGLPFVDADDLHSPENRHKMAAGQPLNDDDRWPWLSKVGEVLSTADDDGTGMVMACSALKASYRRVILNEERRTRFILLTGPRDLIMQRLAKREGHFMPQSLLDSQLVALEPLADDEPGITVSVTQSPAQIVTRLQETLASL